MGEVRITASNGKVFHGTTDGYAALVSEFNAYEADLQLKKRKEQEEHAKAIAEQKQKEEVKKLSLGFIQNKVDLLNREVEKFEKETGNRIGFVLNNGKLAIKEYGNGIYINDQCLDLCKLLGI